MERQSRGFGNLILGGLLIVLGALFLLAQFVEVDLLEFGWPFFIIVPGLLLFTLAVLGGRYARRLAIPAALVTTVGLILLYQNSLDHFESWAYAWALVFPTALGLGLAVSGALGGDPIERRRGLRLALIGLAVFVAGAVFFELVLNISGLVDRSYAAVAGAMLLIALGVWLLLRRPRAE